MADPFPTQDPVVPTSIGFLRIILNVPAGGDGADTQGEFLFDVLDAEGEKIRSREGNLAPHLTTTEKQQVATFMNAMLAKAAASLPQT